ncbi:MAG: chorismate synthase [Candidatus Omnitrophota bacterium]
MLRFLTAGESHGKALAAILDGMPAGLKVDTKDIDKELKRRQSGYGRGPRMQIEFDKIEILSGLRKGISIGSPIGLMISNKDSSIDEAPTLTVPRPGHADLAGAIKFGFSDIANVLERSSARETAIRTAVGAVCKIFLDEFKIKTESSRLSVGGASTEAEIKKRIDEARNKKDTLGGIFEVKATGLPVGLGSYTHYDLRLDARLAAALMSIPGIKSVEIGLGIGYADKFGSQVHDVIYFSKEKGYFHKTNNAGGLEGGMTNGEDLVVRCCMKPIATLAEPLDSVDIITKAAAKAPIIRADVCAIEAAGVVAEGAVSFELAKAFLEKFGADTLVEVKENFKRCQAR